MSATNIRPAFVLDSDTYFDELTTATVAEVNEWMEAHDLSGLASVVLLDEGGHCLRVSRWCMPSNWSSGNHSIIDKVADDAMEVAFVFHADTPFPVSVWRELAETHR